MSKESTVQVELIADHRESASGVVNSLGKIPGVTLRVEALKFGDYEVPGKLIIERKSASDFAASIIDRRLFAQVEAMHEAGLPHLMILEGDPYQCRIHPNAVIGAISWLVVIAGVPVIPSPSKATTAQLIHTMARHAVHGLGYEVSLQPPKPKAPADLAMSLIGSLPGVGPKMAFNLLTEFGSARGVANASPEALVRAEGVGPGSAKKITAVLDHPF